MNRSEIRVLVVDDHPIVRRGLCAEIELSDGMKVAGEAEDGSEAVEMALRLNPNVILMDLILPMKSGVEAIKEIVDRNPQARILVLTSFCDDDLVYSAIQAGATGYILKERHPEEVLSAIRTIANGEPFLHPQVAKGLFRSLRNKSKEDENPCKPLTEREMEVLHWLAKGTPNKEIAKEIGVSQATVRAHVSNILSKLGLENRSQAVLYAVQSGLVDTQPAPV
jgi:DNA-binding NarL/FixJ family response regulator